LAEVLEEGRCAEGIDCVVADVEPEEGAADESAADELDGLGNFLLEARHEDVVDVEVLPAETSTLICFVCLSISPKASQNCSE
jgi:hypothetical protein